MAAWLKRDQVRSVRPSPGVHAPDVRSQEALSALIEHAPLGVYVVDSHLRLLAINRIAEAAFRGVDRPIGRDLREIAKRVWPAPLAEQKIERFVHTLATGEAFADRIEAYDFRIHRTRLPDGSFGVACFFQDLSPIREAEAVVAMAARRDAFLVELNDRLRAISEPKQIMSVAAEVLARQLDVASVGYSEVASDGDTILVGGEFRDERLPDARGVYRISDIGEGFGPVLRAGHDIFSEDVRADPRGVSGGSPVVLALQVRAGAVTPLIKRGRLVAYLYVMHDEPRAWPDWQRRLIRETAERTWAAVEHARAQNDLVRQTVQFETLLNRAPIGVYVVDSDLCIRQVNPAARPLFRDMPNLVGRALREVARELWTDECADDLLQLFKRTLETGEPYAACERPEKRRHEEVDSYYEWRIDRIPLPDGRPGVVCYCRDVSASVRTRAAIVASENALRASEEHHAFLLALSDAVRPLIDPVAIQAETARSLGEHLNASRALYGEVESREDGNYYVVGPDYRAGREGPSDFEDVPVRRLRAEEYGVALFEELRAGSTVVVPDVALEPRLTEQERAAYAASRMKAHVAVPLIKEGHGLAFMAVQQDVPRAWTESDIELIEDAAERTWAAVERARAEAKSRESQARLELALDASNMGTFIWHVREDRGEPDARLLALFGLKKDQTLNFDVAVNVLVHPDDRARYAAGIRRAIDPRGTGALREDFRVVHPDGSIRWLTITAQVMFEGTPRRAVRMVGMASDITARKQTEEALREREELLRDTDRRKDEFLAMLAHELRNPLAPIRTGLEMLRIARDKPEAIERVRLTMERQVGHMVRLVDDLLDVSRITSGKIRLQRQPTELSTLINTAVEANRAALNAAKIDLGVDLPASPLVLDVDPTRFVQVVSNLLHNAVKFTKAGGHVRVAAKVDAPFPGTPADLELTVSDSGVGISQDMLPRVFDLFTQGDAQSTQPGLGIGLALARRLVEMHGGSIDASSAGPGQGSTFTIRMPLSTAVREQRPVNPANPSQIKRQVVVIDDNEDSADMTAMFVSALGAESRVAYDGESGLSLIREHRPDVVLLDIGMPGIDGYETCRRIRKSLGADVFVVAMTGWGQERDKLEAKNAGFNAHLTKPVDPAVLKRLLADVMPPR
jgi:PAS domain S-box-containing protein